MSLSIVTVCMNRSHHLLQSAPRVAALPWHREHLVVDWSSSQPLRREQLPPDPRLRLLPLDGVPTTTGVYAVALRESLDIPAVRALFELAAAG